MRTLTSTLLNAQKAKSVEALVKVVLTHGDTYTYLKDRIKVIEEKGDGSLQSIDITLDNYDKSLTDIDLKGYEAVLSYGAVTKAGEEYSALAPMWVLDQRFSSEPDKLDCTLIIVGMCNLMARDEASESYEPDSEDTKSVKTLIDEIAGASMTCFSHCKAYEVVWDTGYNTLADTYIPKDAFRVYARNNRNSAIDRLLEYTKNVKRAEADGKLHIFLPTTTGTTYDAEYSLAEGQHHFFAKALRNRVVFPNYVKVQSRDDDSPQYSGTAQDDGYATLPAELKNHHYKKTSLESDAEATDIAEAILARAQMWSQAGAANVPMNVGTEAFDYVNVVDSREGDSRAGNIGKYTRHVDIRKNKWYMVFDFGNWQNVRKALEQIGVSSDDLENYFSRLSVKNLYAENILAGQLNMVWIDPEGNIDLSQIGDTLDNLPDGEQYARVSTVNLHFDEDPESPTYQMYVLKLDEHTVYQSGYDPTTKEGAMTKSATAPESPSVDDLWLDTSVVPNILKIWTGSAWVNASPADLDDLPDRVGGLYQRTKSASLSADGLVLLDQTQIGTYALVRATDITDGQILLSEAFGDLGDISGDLSDIQDGGGYGRIKLTCLDGNGYIELNSNVKVDGEWYNESGLLMDSSKGIRLYGEDMAFATFSNESDARAGTNYQCKMDSSGRIVAGGGDVRLDSDGLTLKGESVDFQDSGGTTRGKIYGASTLGGQIIIGSSYNIHLAPGWGINSNTDIICAMALNSVLRPIEDGYGWIGEPNYQWARIYAEKAIISDLLYLPRSTSNPSTTIDGTVYYNTSANEVRVRKAGTWTALAWY